MGTFKSFRQAYGALKDSTKVGLAKVNSDFKDLDIAIVKATNHVECPPKERHVRKIFSATSVVRPRADVAYCIHALAKRLSKTRNWIPEGAAYSNYLIQYALALVLKESFKIYCAINDGIINLVDMFFGMSKHDAVKALNIYKRAGHQAENLAEFYEYCKGLDLARNFQFPTLRQPPPSFLATMEEYIKEAPHAGSVQNKLEYEEREPSPPTSDEPVETERQEEKNDEEHKSLIDLEEAETQLKEESEKPPQPLISTENTGDLLDLNEINPKAVELEESNALALAMVPPGTYSTSGGLSEIGGPGWELALVTTPSNNTAHLVESKLAGGFDKLLLDSLYEDEGTRRQIELRNAGYGYGYEGMGAVQNPCQQQQHDPFIMSNSIAPPTNVQMALLVQQQQQYQHEQMQMMLYQQQQQHQQQQQMMMTMVPYQFPQQQQQMQYMASYNPFGDPFFNLSPSSTSQQGNHALL